MPELTPNLGLKKPLGNETVSRAAYNENLDIIDANAVKKGEGIAELAGGTLAERPNPGIVGRYYFAQDTGEIYLDTGTEWILAAASGKEFSTLQSEFNEHSADYAPHNSTSEATANRLVLRDANGRSKVAMPIEAGQAMNISDLVSGSYTSGQTETSNIALHDGSSTQAAQTYLVTVRTTVDVSTINRGVYLVSFSSDTTFFIDTIIDNADVSLSVNASYQLEVQNVSGANRAIKFTIICLGRLG